MRVCVCAPRFSNAVKFTHRGFVALTVSMNEQRTHNIKFEVEDTGIGIALDQLPQLFQPFAQADATMTRRYGGTGLGLVVYIYMLG